MWLHDDKFQELFGVSKIEWNDKKLPAWKKKNLKVQHRLSVL